MCTTFVKKLDDRWLLGKTRDPVPWMRWDDEMKLFNSEHDRFAKLIVQNPNPREDGYYGGINEKGVAYISTFVRVAEDQVSYIRRPYVRQILDAATAKEAVAIIESFNPRIGGNMFVADTERCFGIEGAPEEYFVEEIKDMGVKTNHFKHLPNRNMGFDTDVGFEVWSKTHEKRAWELIGDANGVGDFKNILSDRENADAKTAICTTSEEEECYTHSAFVFDAGSVEAHYAQGNPAEVEFKKFTFS